MSDKIRPAQGLARSIGLALMAAMAIAILAPIFVGDGGLEGASTRGAATYIAALRSVMIADALSAALACFVAYGFYKLLAPVNAAFAGLAATCRIVAAGVTGFGVFLAYDAIGDINSLEGVDDFSAALQANAAHLTELRFDLFHWSLIVSSVGAALTYLLLFAGGLVPRLLSAYGFVASIGAVVGASAIYLAPSLSEAMFPAYVAANAVAYISLFAWLIIFGVGARRNDG